MGHPEDAWNIRLLGHSDLNGHGDGMQIMKKGQYLFVGHMASMGTSVVDVADPRNPRVVRQIPVPANTHSHKAQLSGDVLLVNHEQYRGGPPHSAALLAYDVSDPVEPREIGRLEIGGRGVHRIWWDGERYAYFSATPEGFNDRIFVIADVSDPTRMEVVGKWWWPGQWVAGGEEPTWPEGRRYAAHHALLAGGLGYMGYGDAGIVVLNLANPVHPELVGHVNWPEHEGGDTHTAMPLIERGICVVTDESVRSDCDGPRKYVRLVDISNPAEPRVVRKLPEPEGDFCSRGLRYGPHNLHENRAGSFVSDSIIFVTYFNAGLRVYDISRLDTPREIAHYIPECPPGQEAIQINDVLATSDGLVYITDRRNGGVYVLEMTGL